MKFRSGCVLVVLSLCGVLLPAGGWGQSIGTVTGTVRAQGGLPLSGVVVRFEPAAIEAVTDALGHFELTVPAATPGVTVFARAGLACRQACG